MQGTICIYAALSRTCLLRQPMAEPISVRSIHCIHAIVKRLHSLRLRLKTLKVTFFSEEAFHKDRSWLLVLKAWGFKNLLAKILLLKFAVFSRLNACGVYFKLGFGTSPFIKLLLVYKVFLLTIFIGIIPIAQYNSWKFESFILPWRPDVNALTFLFLWSFLEWKVVTGMEVEEIIESFANYIWFLRLPNYVYISHLLLMTEEAQWICDVTNVHFFGYI